jgi:hypothetical protein
MLRGNHYRGHLSTPTPEYLTDMNKHFGGRPAADDFIAEGRAALAKSDAVFKKATASLERLESFMAPAKTDEPLAKFETTNPVLAAAFAKIDALGKKLDDTLNSWQQSQRSPRETSPGDVERPASPVRVET